MDGTVGVRRGRRPAQAVLVAAVSLGGGSLLLFGGFLLGWRPPGARSAGPHWAAWDAGLSLAFFVQHSGMVRRPVRRRLAAVVPERYDPAGYAIASGATLLVVLLAWQPSADSILVLTGAARWAARTVALAALLGIAATVRALHSFDPFGRGPIRRYLRGRPGGGTPALVVAGPYRWVRHPIYAWILVLIWTAPDLTADRLLFDLLWTGWIIVGSRWEERDLSADFPQTYPDYRSRVPQLLPWRGRAID